MGRPRAGEFDTATTERLLRAAEEEFGRKGYEAARLLDVARAAGIGRASLLYHFESKERLYGEVVRRAFARLGAALQAAVSSPGSYAERLDRVVSAYLDFLRRHPAIARLLLRELLDGRGPGQDLLVQQVAPLLRRVEAFVRREGGAARARALPVREALMQIATSALVRASAGPLVETLWGDRDHTLDLARRLLLGEASAATDTPREDRWTCASS